MASLPGLERRPPTSGRVEFCAGVGGTSPFGTPTPGLLCFPPRLMPHTLRKYFRNTGFYSLTVRGPLVVPRPLWTHAFLHAQAGGEHVPHWVGDTELQGPVSSRLWRRTGKRQQLGAESPPPLSPAPPGAIDEVPTPSASEGDCIWTWSLSGGDEAGPNPVRLVSPSEEMGTDTPGEDHVGPQAEDGRLRAERGLGRTRPG